MPIRRQTKLGAVFDSEFINGGTIQPSTRVEVHTIAQKTFSEGHPFRRLGKVKGDIGGPFSTQLYRVDLRGATPEWIRRPPLLAGEPWTQEYFTMPVPSPDISSVSNSIKNMGASNANLDYYLDRYCPLQSNATLDAMGAKAIDMMAPLSPVADTVTTLAEFISERKFFSLPGKAGSLPGEYLNYSFGVAPTVSFAKDLRKAIKEQEDILAQIARDSGRQVRRKGTVLRDESKSSSSVSGRFPSFLGKTPVTNCVEYGTLTTTTTTKSHWWFSGAFTYHFPEEGMMRKVAELDALYGVKPGLGTAWELLPFSWLADYVASLGPAIQNVDRFAQDGLVMPYGYIMAEYNTMVEYTWTGRIMNSTGTMVPRTLTASVEKITKQRRPANPFGFGLLPGDLSGRQWSILGALGLTYLKR